MQFLMGYWNVGAERNYRNGSNNLTFVRHLMILVVQVIRFTFLSTVKIFIYRQFISLFKSSFTEVKMIGILAHTHTFRSSKNIDYV